MAELTSADFSRFFTELHGNAPFPWQKRLAEEVCGGRWPEVIDLPTASGKTACLDIAVFAMAVGGRGPRRVFYIVDRRVVVDAAAERMRAIAEKLGAAKDGVLGEVAGRLRELGGQPERPLETFVLRGGIYRDDSWVRSPLQPTLIASTVDQTGSRLLFRGYGAGDKQWPMHAALAANDALVLLDEAHCSRPFAETLGSIRRYRGWAEAEPGTEFVCVEMTATPAKPGEAFRLNGDDWRDPVLSQRLGASKPARGVIAKTRLRDFDRFAGVVAEEALGVASGSGLRRIAVMVNRVKTARLVYQRLIERGQRAHLLIGRMRPIDRMGLHPDIRGMLAGQKREPGGPPTFVVATQCLEVGADLDFDGLVTECADVDSLLQRFGRLDRLGQLTEQGVTAQGRIVIAEPMTEEKYIDPIYGGALSRTWAWLQGLPGWNFAVRSADGGTSVREMLLAAKEGEGLRRAALKAPVLLPSHLDLLAQTSPRPALEPDIALYLHGPEKGPADVQVVWRADLDPAGAGQWAEIVAQCPPVTLEAMPVPLSEFRAWLTGGEPTAAASDLEGGTAEEGSPGEGLRCPVLVWQGDESRLVDSAGAIRAGDTLVVSSASGGWDELGHIPNEVGIDRAEEARIELRRWTLRVHRDLVKKWPDNEAQEVVTELAGDAGADRATLIEALREYGERIGEPSYEWLKRMLAELRPASRLEMEAYPAVGGQHVGWVLSRRQAVADGGQDEGTAGKPVLLDEHLRDVAAAATGFGERLLAAEPLRASLKRAAEMHDYGKADPRFQALLHGGDAMAARFAPRPRAKGEAAVKSPAARRAQWRRSGLPDGFRHELVSLLLVRGDPEIEADDLALHLIASHHGRCRPFAPVVEDGRVEVSYEGRRIREGDRAEQAAHRLDSGVSDRYWRLTRRYGWWGLAYLETLLRLSDWQASKAEENSEGL